MKRFFLPVFICAIATQLAAQGVDADNRPDMDRDRIVFNLHWDGWLNTPDSIKVNAFSRGVGFHFFYDIPLDKKNQFSFAPGIGYSCSNYYSNALFVEDSTDKVIVDIIEDGVQVNKNKIALGLLEVPVEFRFRSMPDGKGNSFKLAIGFKGGWQFTNKTKYAGDDIIFNTPSDVKVKIFRYEALNMFRYGPTVRIGYGAINLQAFYGLSELFNEGEGPTGFPLEIGVSFNPF